MPSALASTQALLLLLLCAALHGAQARSQSEQLGATAVSSEGIIRPFLTSGSSNPFGVQRAGVKLAVKHMSKMGGSFMIDLLNEMTVGFVREPGRQFFTKYFEEYPGPNNHFLEERNDYFVIAGVRNPCEWYVSQWAFSAKYDNRTLRYMFGRDFFGNLHTQSKFADWLQWAMGAPSNVSLLEWVEKSEDANPGVLSVRFWESFIGGRTDYVPPEKSPQGLYATTLLDQYSRFYAQRDDVVTAIKDFKPMEHADCWVRQETYEEDFKHCLEVYEMLSGTELNWRPFERSYGNTTFFHTVSRNPSRHGACESYYTPDLAAAVRKLDQGLFDAFAYPTCCGRATGPTVRSPL